MSSPRIVSSVVSGFVAATAASALAASALAPIAPAHAVAYPASQVAPEVCEGHGLPHTATHESNVLRVVCADGSSSSVAFVR